MAHDASEKHRGNHSHRAVASNVPKVRLYVERPGKADDWFVNVGHITGRGRWRTEPHAHPGYGQIIFVRNGRGVMNLEGRGLAFEGPCALLLPTDCVHGLDYDADVDKWVVTVEVSYLAQVNAKLPELVQLWALPRVIALSHDSEAEAKTFQTILALDEEVTLRGVGHLLGTEALITSLLILLVRSALCDKDHTHALATEESQLVARFRALVDEHCRANLSLSQYAAMVGVSQTRLRASCIAATGLSPTKLIHAHLVSEAKRSLIFDDMPVEQIAYGLGFTDAAYFARFFRKEVGQSPSQFRSAARGDSRAVAPR